MGRKSLLGTVFKKAAKQKASIIDTGFKVSVFSSGILAGLSL
jgi:hypothetical protein